jgi:hypothetical protein
MAATPRIGSCSWQDSEGAWLPEQACRERRTAAAVGGLLLRLPGEEQPLLPRCARGVVSPGPGIPGRGPAGVGQRAGPESPAVLYYSTYSASVLSDESESPGAERRGALRSGWWAVGQSARSGASCRLSGARWGCARGMAHGDWWARFGRVSPDGWTRRSRRMSLPGGGAGGRARRGPGVGWRTWGGPSKGRAPD